MEVEQHTEVDEEKVAAKLLAEADIDYVWDENAKVLHERALAMDLQHDHHDSDED